MVLAHHLLLAGSVGALAAAGVRVASRLSAAWLERVVAGAVIAAGAAVIQALVLGLVGLGTEPLALFAAALLTWLAVRRLISPPAEPLGDQLAAAWQELPSSGRLAGGAVAGAMVAWTAWLLHYPGYGWDGLTYHIPEVVAWVHNGQPGSIEPILPGWPVGNYPLTNEVLVAWGAGLGRSFVWITVWPTLMIALLSASGWLGLRALRVAPLPSALATASVVTAPLLSSSQLNGPNTDLPAIAWLVATGALCAAAARAERPELLAPAVLAAGLAIGTKTTSAPLAVLALALAAYRFRAQLRPLARPLGLAAAGAVAVGGTWYLRNLIDHGSPTWPFFPLPWGDPAPRTAYSTETFRESPLKTLGHLDDPAYVRDNFLGGLAVLLGAVCAAFLARRRAVAVAGAATVLSFLLWTNAPTTGSPQHPGQVAAFNVSARYLMAGVAAGALTLALASRDGGRWTRRLAGAVLVAAVCLNVFQLFDTGYPQVPALGTPLVGAALGGALALGVSYLPLRLLLRPAGALTALLVLAVVLAASAPGIPERHARMAFADAGIVRWFAGPAADGRPIYMTPIVVGILAGDDLDRRVEAIPLRTSCRDVEARASRGWVVVSKLPTDQLFEPSTTRGCVSRWQPAFEDDLNRVYGPASLARNGTSCSSTSSGTSSGRKWPAPAICSTRSESTWLLARANAASRITGSRSP